ncbi:CPBP family intramembrane metalloprotease [Clostridium pasteurianum]|uniref:CPBP family intramembrane glutamic endopeptidase n=1 Tax=Clostridium pasteurianum TaxID=1501 RepID=UPI002260F610|nr:CPBP family intramembrane glutamic endopeptidase [Clostridium pasteurianum]UZW12573.1 CPBP family intramembrane metalloprotease [Clostridium pasteurianum]
MNHNFKKEIFLYLIIVYGITYLVFSICRIVGMDYRNFVSFSMLLPTFGAIITTLIFKEKFSFILKNLKINKWIFVGIITIILVYILCSIFQIVIYGFVFKQFNLVKIPSILIFLQQILIGIILGGLSATFEEIGWRGFLQSRLILKNTFFSYLFIGICWSVFHFPQIFAALIYAGNLIEGLIIHTCILVSFNILLCYMREKSSSLICTSITHGLFNVLIYTQATDVISRGNQIIEGALWAILFVIIIVILFFKNYKRELKASINL